MVGGDSGGGSRQLAELIDEHSDAIVSDLSIYHGIKPWEIIDGPYPPRLLLAYITNLPEDSATMASLRGGPEHRGWDMKTHLLASIFDAVQNNTYVLVSANSKRKPKPPQPIPRPKVKERKKNPKANKFAAMARLARRRAVRQAETVKGTA